MRYLVEFKSWEDDNALNEQVSAEYAYGFKASDTDASGADKSGFAGLKAFYSYLADGTIKVEGLEPTMKLTAWMKTEGFKNSENKLLSIVYRNDNNKSKNALAKFKETFPEKYAMMIAWANHEKFGKEYKDEPVTRYSPLGLERKSVVYAADFYTGYETPGVPKETSEGEPENVPPILYPAAKIEIPQDIDTSDFFEFNSWTLSEKFKTWLTENVINPSKEAISKLNPPEGKPKSYLNSLKVTTSSSTIPNGVSPEDKKKHTFAELSDLRAESTIKYLKEELAKIGVLIDGDTKIEKSTKGTNAGKKSTVSYASQPVGTDLTGTSGEEWDKTDANKEVLKKYQKVAIETGLIFNDTKRVEPVKGAETKPAPVTTKPKESTVVKEKAFFVTIRAVDQDPWRFTFPKIRLNLGSIFRFESKRNWGSTKCYKF
jgi:hypothetical protein